MFDVCSLTLSMATMLGFRRVLAQKSYKTPTMATMSACASSTYSSSSSSRGIPPLGCERQKQHKQYTEHVLRLIESP